MRFEFEQRFAHAPDDVERALLDGEFIARMATLPKLGAPQVLGREQHGSVVTLRVRYAFAGDVSPAVRRVVDPARLTWVEESVNDTAAHTATFRVLPDHYASLMRCEGTYAVRASLPGASRVARGEVRVTVPLVGWKVERAIVSGMQEHAQSEAELVDAWLDQR